MGRRGTMASCERGRVNLFDPEWAPYRSGKTWVWKGSIGEIHRRVLELRQGVGRKLALLEKAMGSLSERRARVAVAGARAARVKRFQRFSKGYWKFFFKALVKPKKGWILLLLPGVLAGLCAHGLFGLAEDPSVTLAIVFCFVPPVIVALLALVYRDRSESAGDDRLSICLSASMPLLHRRLALLERLLQVLMGDVEATRQGRASIVYCPWMNQERRELPSALELELPLVDGNRLHLELGFDGGTRTQAKEGKVKRRLVAEEILHVRLDWDATRYALREKLGKDRQIGALGKLAFSGEEGSLEVTARLRPTKISLTGSSAQRLAGLAERLAREEDVLQALSYLYGQLVVLPEALPGRSPLAMVGASSEPPERDRSVLQLAREILADGVITRAEKERLQAAIAADGVIDGFEQAVVEKIKVYVQEGRVKYMKE